MHAAKTTHTMPFAALATLVLLLGCTDVSITESDNDADGWTQEEGDCNDQDAPIHPAATEVCNGTDDNCDGVVDEGFDADGDGHTTCGADGEPGTPDDDCDDSDADINPTVGEVVCDDVDNDCDPATSDTPDDDGDSADVCMDCDDSDAALNLDDTDGDGATSCDGDCNDLDSAFSLEDLDGDGWTTCDGDCDDDATLHLDDADGDGFDTCNGDCDDTESAVYDGAPDVCDDHLDNDCDGLTDPSEADDDGDGWTECDGDCDDAEVLTCPDGIEVGADLVDNDCDGIVDDDRFVQVSAGRKFACGLTLSGTLECWGMNEADYDYTTWIGHATPPAGDTYLAVATGYQYACALRTDGGLDCWGSNWGLGPAGLVRPGRGAGWAVRTGLHRLLPHMCGAHGPDRALLGAGRGRSIVSAGRLVRTDDRWPQAQLRADDRRHAGLLGVGHQLAGKRVVRPVESSGGHVHGSHGRVQPRLRAGRGRVGELLGQRPHRSRGPGLDRAGHAAGGLLRAGGGGRLVQLRPGRGRPHHVLG